MEQRYECFIIEPELCEWIVDATAVAGGQRIMRFVSEKNELHMFYSFSYVWCLSILHNPTESVENSSLIEQHWIPKSALDKL